jgi:hypothetical protein
MKDEKSQRERIEQLTREILKMTAIAKMCGNAPRDNQGNVVVSVVGIGNIGLFYQFNN